MSKPFQRLLIFSLIFLLFGCDNASGPAVTATDPPTPAQAAQPTPTPAPEPTPAIIADAPMMAYNDIKEGQLTDTTDVEPWTFVAQAGEYVNLVLNSQFDSYLELYGPDGDLIASGDDTDASLDAALLNVLITRSGLHTATVRGYSGATGEYALALTGGHPTSGGGTLVDEEQRTVMLSTQGMKWLFDGEKNTYLTVNLHSEAPASLTLSLFGPEGTLLTREGNRPGDAAEIFEFQLPADGLYTVQAQTNGDSGLATLTLASQNAPSGGGPITLGETRTGDLPPGRVHRWQFSGTADQIINLSLASSDFDTFLELRDAEGGILAENDDSRGGTDAAIDQFILPADGSYTIVTRGLAETDGGTYELTLKPVKVPAGGGTLLPDRPTQARLQPGQDDTWDFEANANSFVTINIESSVVDTYLELYDPDGELLTEDDDGGGDLNAAILDFPLPEDGLYKAVVSAAQEGSQASGVYDVTLTLAENLETSGVLISGEPQKSTLEADEQQSWTFEAEEDYFVTIKMASPTLDTYLALYNSEGTLLAVNDDFLGRQAIIANFIVPEMGQYRVVARTYSGEAAGDYTIYLDVTEEALPLRSIPVTAPKEN